MRITMYLSLKLASQTVFEQQKCSFPNLSQQCAPAAGKASPFLGWNSEGTAGRAGNGFLHSSTQFMGLIQFWCPQIKRDIGKWETILWMLTVMLNKLENSV